jgi:hypothetical protein
MGVCTSDSGARSFALCSKEHAPKRPTYIASRSARKFRAMAISRSLFKHVTRNLQVHQRGAKAHNKGVIA